MYMCISIESRITVEIIERKRYLEQEIMREMHKFYIS